VLAIFTREVFAFYRERARQHGWPDGHTGSVTVIQRFGGALNLNPHFHTLVLDGVFSEGEDGALRFLPLPAPADRQVAEVLARVVAAVTRLLVRRGIWVDADGESAADGDPTLHDRLSAASIRQVALTGPRSCHPIARIRSRFASPTAIEIRGRRSARVDGFDLHANTTVRANSRQRLERLCRYLLRPPLSEGRLELRGDRIQLELKSTWSDGTTHLLFEPSELLERLAALVPRPHKNLVLYHGVLAGNARWRKQIVAHGRPGGDADRPIPEAAIRSGLPPPRANPSWAELMRRGLDIDALDCPKCHGRMRFIAAILRPSIIARILRSLDLLARMDRSVSPKR
jgi:hypothetical protein